MTNTHPPTNPTCPTKAQSPGSDTSRLHHELNFVLRASTPKLKHHNSLPPWHCGICICLREKRRLQGNLDGRLVLVDQLRGPGSSAWRGTRGCRGFRSRRRGLLGMPGDGSCLRILGIGRRISSLIEDDHERGEWLRGSKGPRLLAGTET